MCRPMSVARSASPFAAQRRAAYGETGSAPVPERESYSRRQSAVLLLRAEIDRVDSASLSILCCCLAYLTARLHILGGCNYAEALICIDSAENHALTLDTHHGARCKVSHEKDTLANQFLWLLVEGSDT